MMPNLRKPYIAGNWKMHKTSAEASSFVGRLLPKLPAQEKPDVGLCVPYTALVACVEAARGTNLRIAAQNMHYAESGPYTGEISPPMLVELGVSSVVLGHSERRHYNCETDQQLAEKVPAALDAGLEPILCVGESESERHRGATEDRLFAQVDTALASVDPNRLSEIVIAYEPVWAIGTGEVATPAQAQDASAFLRSVISRFSTEASSAIRILYGGSVKADNANEILSQADIDGALVGGESLDPHKLASIAASV
jgi:triosephosphate isomerase (TIM)